MILLDTNVVSDLAKAPLDPALRAWFAEQDAGDLGITVMTIFEIGQGLARLPDGHRKAALERAMAALIGPKMLGRGILSLNAEAARQAGILSGGLDKVGQPIGAPDCLIAGIALQHGATLATRNTRHFSRIEGLSLVNPWGD